MRVYICVDDTDDMTKSTSTGKIADLIAKELARLGGRMEKGITRHQLLLHDDIDYTSHNSSMCMVIDIDGVDIPEMPEVAEKVLKENMADTADPGLCFCRLDQLEHPELLIAYGKRAQNEVIQKQEAYDMACQLGGTYLTEHGGTGCGVIGALAGVGLRLSGCDGVFRGNKNAEFKNKVYTVAQWRELTDIELFLDFDGNVLNEEDVVQVGDQLKTLLVDHKNALVSTKQGEIYKACKKKDIYHNEKRVTTWTTACGDFQRDNDADECYDDSDNACYNCLYRRWEPVGYSCKKHDAITGEKSHGQI